MPSPEFPVEIPEDHVAKDGHHNQWPVWATHRGRQQQEFDPNKDTPTAGEVPNEPMRYPGDGIIPL